MPIPIFENKEKSVESTTLSMIVLKRNGSIIVRSPVKIVIKKTNNVRGFDALYVHLIDNKSPSKRSLKLTLLSAIITKRIISIKINRIMKN